MFPQLQETKSHAEPKGQGIAEENDHHGVAHSQADLEAIADTASPGLHHSGLEFAELLKLAAKGDHRAHGVETLLDDCSSLGVPTLRFHLNFLNRLSHDGSSNSHEGQHGTHHQRHEPTQAKGASKATDEGRA